MILLTLVGTCGAKMKIQPIVNVHYFFGHVQNPASFVAGPACRSGV